MLMEMQYRVSSRVRIRKLRCLGLEPDVRLFRECALHVRRLYPV